MKLAIFGATGRIGNLVVRRALELGHAVSAYARSPSHAGPFEGDVRLVGGALDAVSVEATLAGSEAVIVALAAGNGVLARFDRLALPYLVAHGPRRIVSLVGAAVRLPGDPDAFSLTLMSLMMRLIPNGLLADASGHAKALAGSGLDWTLVRAANFVDRPPTGRLRSEPAFAMPLNAQITRADLAAFMLETATGGRFVRQAPMVCDAGR